MFQLPRFHRLIHNGGMMFVEIKQPYLGHQKLAPWRHNLTVVTHLHSTQEVTDDYGMYWSLIYVLSLMQKPGCIYLQDGSVSLAYMYIHKENIARTKLIGTKFQAFILVPMVYNLQSSKKKIPNCSL